MNTTRTPTTEDTRWSVVDIKPVEALKRAVPLKTIKQESMLSDMQLVRRSRLSVTPVTEEEFGVILQLGGMADDEP